MNKCDMPPHPWAPRATPTPEEWRDYFLTLTPEQQAFAAKGFIADRHILNLLMVSSIDEASVAHVGVKRLLLSAQTALALALDRVDPFEELVGAPLPDLAERADLVCKIIATAYEMAHQVQAAVDAAS